MDAKVIILLVFILFGMIVAYMVANGMVDLTSIFSRVTKSQAEQSLGGVKLEVVSPVAGVYYQATKNTNGDGYYIDLKDIVKITGKNLDQKTLTVSVATSHWYITSDDVTSSIASATLDKTVQHKFDGSDLSADTNGVWTLQASQYLVRGDLSDAPFNMPEFVELIFAIGETAKAEVTIVAEP